MPLPLGGFIGQNQTFEMWKKVLGTGECILDDHEQQKMQTELQRCLQKASRYRFL